MARIRGYMVLSARLLNKFTIRLPIVKLYGFELLVLYLETQEWTTTSCCEDKDIESSFVLYHSKIPFRNKLLF